MKSLQYLSTLVIVALMALTLRSPALSAQNPLADALSTGNESAEAVDPTTVNSIERRIAEVTEEERQLAQVIADSSTAPPLSTASKHLERSQEKLQQMLRLLQAQLSLAKSLATPVPPATAETPADEPSVLLLNVLYEQLSAAESALREKRNHLKSAKEQLESLESRSREARAELATASKENRARSERAARSAVLSARVQAEQVYMITLELRAAKAAAEQGNNLEARIAEVRESLADGEGQANAATSVLLERERALQQAKTRAERELATAELRLAAEKRRFSANPPNANEVLAVVEALTAYHDALGKQVSLATSELDRLSSVRDIWANWDALLRATHTPDDLPAWQELADSELADLKVIEDSREGQSADLQIRLEGLHARISQLPAQSQVRAVSQEAEKALNTLQSELLAADRQLAADQRVTQRFADEITRVTGNLSFFDYLSRGMKQAEALWNFEITTINESPFTVGSLTMGILLFAAGLWASRVGAAAIGRLAARRLKLDAGAVQAMQTFSFYALLIGFSLLALRAVHFPLTAFAFLGGALAIGVGFGSQNVMNNFISGLILMLERPVRAQDVVEVDGSHGVIQRIGPRSTHIRSTDGRHIVVPNSFFLESNVVNWTLSDDLMRTKVSVGVSYGSPTRLVKQLMEEILRDEPLVLNEPPPNVIFDAFGDNSLNFDAYFWVEARAPMRVREAQSRVRFAIDEKFREHDLVIAFPQRDVHLDTLTPLQVRLVDAGDD
ncbi:MAG: mechanosensitive ion channel [Halioglobus sp.]